MLDEKKIDAEEEEKKKISKMEEVMVFDMGSGVKRQPPTLGQRKQSSQKAAAEKPKKDNNQEVEILISEKDTRKILEDYERKQEKATK